MICHRDSIHGCQALFFPAQSVDHGGNVGLLMAGLRSTVLLKQFPEWTLAWQTAGYTVAAYDFRDDRFTWGSDVSIATLDALLDAAQQRWPVRRPIVCGSSRGGLTTLVWAHRNQGVPVAWFGLNPVIDLDAFYDLPGRAISLNAAYAIANKSELLRNVCPRTNPIDLAPELNWLPMRTWQGREDTVTPPHALERFHSIVRRAGGSHSIVYGSGGHATYESVRDQFDAGSQIRFAREAESCSIQSE